MGQLVYLQASRIILVPSNEGSNQFIHVWKIRHNLPLSTKEDRDLILQSDPYFMETKGIYLNRWTIDCNPKEDISKVKF